MDIYKKKGLNFTKGIDSRQLRAYKRSEERRNSKHVRLSSVRNIDAVCESFENSISESISHEEPTNVQTEFRKPQIPPPKPLPTSSRLEALKKWKTEKELKRKFEATKKAKPFVVSWTSQTSKVPTNTGMSKPQGIPSLRGPNVSMKSKIVQDPKPNGIVKKIPAPGIVKTMPASGIVKTLPAPGIVKKVPVPGLRKPATQSVVPPAIKPVQVKSLLPAMKTTTGLRKTPALQGSLQKIANRIPPSVAKDVKLPSFSKARFPTPTKIHSIGAKPPVQPVSKLNSSRIGKAASLAKSPKQVAKPVDKEQKSFAPSDFKFRPPLGLVNKLFPDGIMASSNRSLLFSPKKKFGFLFGKTAESSSQDTVKENNQTKTSTKIQEKSVEQKAEKSETNSSPELQKKTSFVTSESQNLVPDKSESSEPPRSEPNFIRKGRSSTRRSCFHDLEDKLGSIAEEPQCISLGSLKMEMKILTPRRSKRLASLTPKAMVSAEPKGLIGQFSDMDVGTPKVKKDQLDDTFEEQENKTNRRHITRRKHSSHTQNPLSPLQSIPLNSPGRPLTRAQHKISLLGSPYKPHIYRQSFRGDLISFSPI